MSKCMPSRLSITESRNRLCTRKLSTRWSAMRKSSLPVCGSGKMMSISSLLPLITWKLVTSHSSRLTSITKPEPELSSE